MQANSETFKFPIITNTPKTEDTIYVPDFNEPTDLGRRYGGWATVQRVRQVSADKHYLTVGEHTGFFELAWEDFLAPIQEELSEKFHLQRAYLKS